MSIRKALKMKKIIGMVLAFILMIGVCGCHMRNKEEKENKKEKQTDHEVVVEMKDYLRDKYGYIDYDFVAFRRRSTWGDPYDLLLLTTSYGEDDEVEFCVRRFEQNGENVCADNYVQFLTADELEKEMREFTGNYFSEFKLNAIVGGNNPQVFPLSFKTYDDIKDRYDEISDIIPQNSFLYYEVAVKESSLSGVEEFNTIKEKYESDLKEFGFAWCYNLVYVDDKTFDGFK